MSGEFKQVMLININQFAKLNNPLLGVHVGTVMDNNDSNKLSRVKCSVEGLIEGATTLLPWFSLRNSSFFGSKSDTQMQIVPDIGSKVLIAFPDNNPYTGEVIGYYDSSSAHNTDLDADYPETYGFKDSKGNIFKINKTSGEIKITHNAGTEIIVHPDGHIELGTDASEFICMGTKVKEWISNEIDAKYNSHTHPLPTSLDTTLIVVPGGAGIGAISGIAASTSTPTPTMSDPTEADIASEQHKVGN